MNRYTRVLALVVFYEHGTFNPGKLFKVLSCVIYTFNDRYICIDYLGTEAKKISQLNLGCSWKTTNASTLVYQFISVLLVSAPNVLLKHVFTWSLKALFMFKCGFNIYAKKISLIRWFVSSIQFFIWHMY